MDDTEYKAVYQRLAEILDKSGLGWILSQVAEEIRTGKTREVEIETLKSRRITTPLVTIQAISGISNVTQMVG